MYRNLIVMLFVFACAQAAFSQANSVQLNAENQEQTVKIINGEENQSATALKSDLVDRDKPSPAVKDKSNAPNKRAASDGYHKFEVSGGYSHNFTVCCLTNYQGNFVNVQFFSGGVPVPGANTTISTAFDLRRRVSFKGFDASVTYNFSKYLGATLDFSSHYGSGDLILFGGRVNPSLNSGSSTQYSGTDNAPQRIYNYLGGVQVKNNSVNKKFKPFAHALFGISKQSSIYPDSAGDQVRRIYFSNGDNKFRNSGFAMAFGGGLDISVSKRIDIRVVKFDYNPVYLKSKIITGVADPTNFVLGATTSLEGYRQDNYRLGFGIIFH